jgi:hypothetical protein
VNGGILHLTKFFKHSQKYGKQDQQGKAAFNERKSNLKCWAANLGLACYIVSMFHLLMQLFIFIHMNGYTRCETNVMKEKQQLQKNQKEKEKNTHKIITTKNAKRQGRHMHSHSHS